MDTRELARIDLNLLLSLQVLLEERSVTRAAERLFITQPAMSKTLSRLRQLFADELLVRSGRGMQPTPRAQQLSGALAEALGSISQLLVAPTFDPAALRGEVTLALSEYIGVTLLPRLITRLNAQAPALNIRVVTRVENQLDQLASGQLDFAIQISLPDYDDDYRVEHLGGSPPTILVRNDHPLTRTPVTWERLHRFPLIRLYVPHWEQLVTQSNLRALLPLIDHPLATLEISHLLTALEVLRNSDYFMPSPSYFLQNTEALRGVTGLPVPAESNFATTYSLVAHRRTGNSPLHNWLWQEITCTIRDLRSAQQYKMRQRIRTGEPGT